jgi:hypothetical protein
MSRVSLLDDLIDAGSRSVSEASQDVPALGVVDAETLRGVLLGDEQPPNGRPWIVRGAQVVGQFDLSDAVLRAPLALVECSFDAPVVLERLVTPRLMLISCHAPGVVAGLARVESDLSISKCTITGSVPLSPVQDAHGFSPRSTLRELTSAEHWTCRERRLMRLVAAMRSMPTTSRWAISVS